MPTLRSPRCLLILPFLGCSPPETPGLTTGSVTTPGYTSGPGPTMTTTGGTTTITTAPKKNPCDTPPDPDRGVGWVDLMERLEDQRCLHEDDIAIWTEYFVDAYSTGSGPTCDMVWRVSSPDGLNFEGPAELVHEHASVPDVYIDENSHHYLVFNDVTPWRLIDLITNDPERLWRQGMLGWGGIGMAIDRRDGQGFTEVTELDLNLERLHEAVDPDLGQRFDGTLHLTWFGIHTEDFDGDNTSPLFSAKPHKFYRAASPDILSFPNGTVAIASSEGETGGVDPTILDFEDGRELLMVGPLDDTAKAWWSPDGETWNSDAPPDFDTLVRAATPDARPDPSGGYRLHYMENGNRGTFKVSTSTDGENWDIGGQTLWVDAAGFNVSVDVDPEGVWWLYYNITELGCVDDTEPPMH